MAAKKCYLYIFDVVTANDACGVKNEQLSLNLTNDDQELYMTGFWSYSS